MTKGIFYYTLRDKVSKSHVYGDPQPLRLRVNGTMVDLLRLSGESGVTMRRDLQAFGTWMR